MFRVVQVEAVAMVAATVVLVA